jgi:Fur family ferric uptake transcriptional regulator
VRVLEQLERHLVPVADAGGELAGGVLARGAEGCVQLGVTHVRRFAVPGAVPFRCTPSCTGRAATMEAMGTAHSGVETDWRRHADERLTDAGYRRGGARTALLDLLDVQRCARTVLEIEDELRASDRTIGRASIYRVLDELEQLHLVQRIEVGQGIARYERLAPDHHHHHLACKDCGAVIPFTDDRLEDAIHRLSAGTGFEVTGHDVVLHGTCAACRAAAAASATTA